MIQQQRVTRSTRRLLVEVVDPAGVAIQGADIHFEIDGVQVGSVFSSQGNASIEMDDQDVEITISAIVGFETQAISLRASVGAHRFVFANVPRAVAKGTPSARCPDGTTGQPCVTCNIGGSTVRICG